MNMTNYLGTEGVFFKWCKAINNPPLIVRVTLFVTLTPFFIPSFFFGIYQGYPWADQVTISRADL